MTDYRDPTVIAQERYDAYLASLRQPLEPDDDRAHRRALADVNGDPKPDGWPDGWRFDLLGLAAFVLALIAAVAVVTGHITITIR